jgi:hypothetical protein
MKNSVKGTDKTGYGFTYVRNKFPNVSDAKIKEGIFLGPQIGEVMQDKQFEEDVNKTGRNEWLTIKKICKDLVGNHKAANYQDVDFVQNHVLRNDFENLFSGVTSIFPQKISAKSVTNTVKDFFIGYYVYGKTVPRQVDLKYVGRLLLDNEEGCT